MLSSKDKILIKIDFLPEDSPRNTLTKVKKRNIEQLCESCTKPAQLNAM